MANPAFKFNTTQALVILTLWAFAVAQPLYGLLSGQTGFLVANHSKLGDATLLVFTLSIALPGFLILIKTIVNFFSQKAETLLFNILITLLGTLLLLPFLKGLGIGIDLLVLALALLGGGGICWLYQNKAKFASFLKFLSPTVLIFPALFICFSPVSSIIFEKPQVHGNPHITQEHLTKEYPPIVLIIWDELPTTSLLDSTGTIDTVRYPNFSAFATQATWYTNHMTVGGSTLWAVPSILTGQNPTEDVKHTDAELNSNLFTLLGNVYNMQNTVEKYTTLCPKGQCKVEKNKPFKKLFKTLPDLTAVYLHIITPRNMAKNLPDVSNNWGDFAWSKKTSPSKKTAKKVNIPSVQKTPEALLKEKKARQKEKQKLNEAMAVPNHKRKLFFQFLNKIQPPEAGKKPQLNYLHIVFPHVPYNYLPSGKYYSIAAYKYFSHWNNDREVFYDYQRHLLQMGAVDGLMGDLIQRLKEQGLYDKALIIVTADHGASWDFNAKERRELNKDSYKNIMPVPLFIKKPGQHSGEVIPMPVRTIDILPSIADLVHLPMPGPVDGKSFISEDYKAPKTVKIINNTGKNWLELPIPSNQDRTILVEKKLAWFGQGDHKHIFTTAPFFNPLISKSMYKTALSEVPSISTFGLDDSENYDNVATESDFIPAQITGWINTPEGKQHPKDIAIAVNDIIWATYPYVKTDGKRLKFEAMVPENSFTEGQNTIRLFSIIGTDEFPMLEEILQETTAP